MAKRRVRRGPQKGDFEDPLKNYSPPEDADEFEQSLIDGKVRDLKIEPFMAVEPTMSVVEVLQRMAELDIACVLIVENERLRGIFSERDVLTKVVDRFAQIKDRPVQEVMTSDPAVVHRTDSPAKAINVMAVSGFRHVPILNVDDKVVGVLGPRRITTYLRNFFED